MTREPNPINETTFSGRIAAKIRKRRLRLGLSVQEAAKKSGIPVTTWYNIERGQIEIDRLPEIALYLECYVKSLIPSA